MEKSELLRQIKLSLREIFPIGKILDEEKIEVYIEDKIKTSQLYRDFKNNIETLEHGGQAEFMLEAGSLFTQFKVKYIKIESTNINTKEKITVLLFFRLIPNFSANMYSFLERSLGLEKYENVLQYSSEFFQDIYASMIKYTMSHNAFDKAYLVESRPRSYLSFEDLSSILFDINGLESIKSDSYNEINEIIYNEIKEYLLREQGGALWSTTLN